VLVLDEADTLLDMGFKDTINQLLAVLPKQRRTGLFSATQTKEVRELARAGLRNPVSISVRVQSKGGAENQPGGAVSSVQQATPSTLDNSYMVCPHDQRPDELVTFLNAHNFTRRTTVPVLTSKSMPTKLTPILRRTSMPSK
jgi:ATP-dependent RNA helicase DDX55/SPB4